MRGALRAASSTFYGSELRRLREESAFLQEGLGERAFCSGTYVGQSETGVRRPQKELSQCFDEILDSGEHLQRLCRPARKSKHPEYFADAAALEKLATTYCEYLPMLVPGFLQTEAYAREYTRAAMPLAPPDDAEEHLQSRVERGARLLDVPGPKSRSHRGGAVAPASDTVPVMAQTDLFRDLHMADGNGHVDDDAGSAQGDSSSIQSRPDARQWAVLLVPGAVFVLAGALLAIAVLTVVGGEFAVGRLSGAVPAVGAAFLAVRGRRRHHLGLCCAALGVLAGWGAVFVLLP